MHTIPANSILLDTTQSAESPKCWLFTNPVCILQAFTLKDVQKVLGEIEMWSQKGFFVAGYMAYEAGSAFEAILSDTAANANPEQVYAQPLIWFGVYEKPISITEGFWDTPFNERFAIENLHFEYDEAQYADKIAHIKQHIYEGDLYQINFTGKLHFDFLGEAWAFYQHLRRKQQVAYSAFIRTELQYILSFSPELFFQRQGKKLITRPMKGTMPRGRTLQEDAQNAAFLQQDEKNRAENLMIVDLLRNDLSMICQPQSVDVTALFTIERYQTLLQMTSTIEGTLQAGTTYLDIFRALFPCGSITGAPKIRAMKRIHECESSPRGIYCGAIGYIAPQVQNEAAEAMFNVAIRTLTLDNEKGEMGIGSGIVWDSEAGNEFQECQLKAHFLTKLVEPPFQLIEAVAFENGFYFLPQHIARLQQSAAYFGFAFTNAQEHDLRQTLETWCASCLPDVRYKIRILWHSNGHFEVNATPYTDFPPHEMNLLKLSRMKMASDNPFLYHKTTNRKVYETEYQKAVAEGFREVIFMNEENVITEGSRTNIFIQKQGIWHTPSRNSGILAGVYRQHLLETLPQVVEKELHLDDLLQAEAIFCCNVLRGMERMQFICPNNML